MKHTNTRITLLLCLLISVNLKAQVPTPFNTSVRKYAYIGKTGFNANVATISLHMSDDPTMSDGGFDSGIAVTFVNDTAQSLNGAGINRKDGFMYAIEYLYSSPASNSASLYRIGANAVAEKIGIIRAPTAANAGRTVVAGIVNLSSGFVDSAGTYWFSAYTVTSLLPPYSAAKMDLFIGKVTGLSQYDTSTSGSNIIPTYYKLDISDTTLQRGFTNIFLQQAAMVFYGYPAGNADGGWQDMDINPSDNKIYSYLSFPGAASIVGNNPYPKPAIQSYLVKINNNTYPWKVTPLSTTFNLNPNAEEDGAYFDSTGNFFIGFTNGKYAKINTSTGAVTSIAQSSLPLFNGNLRGDFATNTPTAIIFNPLPLKVLAFNGDGRTAGNYLSWDIASDPALVAIQLERSSDGVAFSSIRSFEAKDAQSGMLDYDPSSLEFYRLKLVSADSRSVYSPIIKVNRAAASDKATTIYPTQVRDQVINIASAESDLDLLVTIIDLAGRQVGAASLHGDQSAEHKLTLQLIQGSYYVIVRSSTSGEQLACKPIVVY